MSEEHEDQGLRCAFCEAPAPSGIRESLLSTFGGNYTVVCDECWREMVKRNPAGRKPRPSKSTR